MGNKIEPQKVKQFINELSETSENNEENFLKSEFQNLFNSLGGNLENNLELQKIIKDYLINLNEDFIINFTKNLLDYFIIQIKNNLNFLKISFNLLLLIIESLYEKNKNLRDTLMNSIKIILIRKENKSEEEIKNLVKNSFPLNILYFCINFQTDRDIFNNPILFNNNLEDKFKISYTLSKIIYSLIYYQKNNEFITENFIEYFDSFKLFISSEIFFEKSKIEDYISILFYTVFLNFNTMIKENLQFYKPELDNYIIINFYILIWFCYDINSFFFKDIIKSNDEISTEFYFENEFNEKVFEFTEKVLFTLKDKNEIITIIQNYKKYHTEFIYNSILYNVNIFKTFIFEFFTNYEKFNNSFKTSVKIFLIFIFESYHVKLIIFNFLGFM